MAGFVLINPALWAHDIDMTGYLNKAALKPSVAEIDSTTFGNTSRTRLGGLKDVEFAAEGFFDAVPDASFFASLGVADRVYTISPEGAEAKTAYLFRADRFQYEAFGKVGEMAPFIAAAKGSNGAGLVWGQIASSKRAVAATGAFGSAVNLGAVSATQSLYAVLHVFSAGTTITVIVESAPTSGFAAPTTRGTIGPITTTGGTLIVVGPGAITDTWYRLNVSAITGSFTVAGAIGIA